MNTGRQVSLEEITGYLETRNFRYVFKGDREVQICGFSSLGRYQEGTVTWVKSMKNWEEHAQDAALCVVQEGVEIPVRNQIICRSSKEVFFELIDHFYGDTEEEQECIGQHTVIGRHVILGEHVRIGNNCSITGHVRIGDGTRISDNVVIKNKVTIGKNCEIQASVILGEDGFGYSEDEHHKKTMVRHHGGVFIGDDVFIGSHVNISRGTIDDTYIGDGVKICGSSYIGHNNYIDQDVTVICADTYGSVQIGKNAYIVGSIIRNQCKVGSDAVIGMGSVVTKDIPAGKVAIGTPARVIRDHTDEIN